MNADVTIHHQEQLEANIKKESIKVPYHSILGFLKIPYRGMNVWRDDFDYLVFLW